MCSILDIDLDFFNLQDNPDRQLEDLLEWARRPPDLIVEAHHRVLRHWDRLIKEFNLPQPTHILHVDEHHDMMDAKETPNIANVMYHAMRKWPTCHVHWLVDHAIDSPEMWLSDDAWSGLGPRFSIGSKRPGNWPRPDIVSVCTSPEFVSFPLQELLMERIRQSGAIASTGKMKTNERA
jgi:hypothetical protein